MADPEIKMATQPVANPAAPSVANPATQPAALSVTQPAANPATQPAAHPASAPVTAAISAQATAPVSAQATSPLSAPVAAMANARFDGFATIRAAGPTGMITLRATPDLPGLAEAFQSLGLTQPGPRRITVIGEKAAGWMSPDETLLILPYAEANAALTSLSDALQGQHHLAANVSDARAIFRIEGAKAAQVLKKLCPVDIDQLAAGELRRSRAAQVPVAFWADADGYTLVCFRSVAGYMMDLLSQSAAVGSELT